MIELIITLIYNVGGVLAISAVIIFIILLTLFLFSYIFHRILRYSLWNDKETKDRIIKIQLIDAQVIGHVNLNRDPQYDRLSDLVASEREPFLIF